MATGTTAEQIIDVVTPAAGESVSEGTILEWRAKVGDFIKATDTIVEISTDKVDVELPSPASGTVTEILVEEGDTVTVGEVIARIAAGEAPASGDGAAAAAETPTAAAETPTAPAETPTAPAQPATPQVTGAGPPSPAQPAEAPAGPAEAPAQPAEAPAGPAEAPVQTAPAAGDGGGSQPAAAPAATPVAQRAAAAEGVDLRRVSGSGPAGRITKSDVLSAAGNGAARAPAAADGDGAAATRPIEGESQLLRGGAAALARYMEQSRAIPTATSFRTLTVDVLDARRQQLKAAGQRVSFTHLIAYAIARATQAMPVMADHFAEIDGKPHRVRDGQVNLGLAVDVEKRDGSRTLMVPVISDAGRMPFARFVAAYDELVEKARTNTLAADDLVGANISLTNPGGLGTAASVPRLMRGQGTIIATGSIGYPPGLARAGASLGAEKVMTMTSTYDHRIIQGAESGRFLGLIESYLHGEDGFYELVFSSLGLELAALSAGPAAAVAPAAAPSEVAAPAPADEQLLQSVQAATALLKAFRTHGHLAARLDPLGSEPEGDPALDPEPLGLTPELMAQIPARILRVYVPGTTLADALPYLRETYCGTIAYEIEHIASHRQRVWLREHIESGAFRQPLTTEERKTLLKRLVEIDALERFMHKAYLGQHQFSIEGLH